MNCRKILKITQPYNMKLVAGKSGLNRIISWFHYMENPEYMEWLKGNELVLTTGMMLSGNTSKLISFINDLYNKEVAGLIINLSPYITHIPKQVIELGDFLGFPIFEAAPEVHIVDISECICKAIIETSTSQNEIERLIFSLIYERLTFNERTLHKAVNYGFNSNHGYRVIIITTSIGTEPMSIEDPTDDAINSEIMKLLDSHFRLLFSKNEAEILAYQENNLLLYLYPTDETENITTTIQKFITSFEKKYPLYHTYSGISPIWSDLRDFRMNYQKAQKALTLISFYNEKPQFLLYEELDIYCSLFSLTNHNELFSLYETALQKLEDYDISSNYDLIQTLNKYIEMNCNMESTANQLFIHVNTLRYRIKKIEQILNCNLKNIEDICKLNLALKIKKYFGLTGNES